MSIKDELLGIKGNREVLTAEEVVEWARSHPGSELHKAPEFRGWNEKESAYEYWLWAARRLVAIHIVYEDGTRKFISLSIDRTQEGGGYRDVDDVIRNRRLHEIMLDDAIRELDRVKERYSQLKRLKPLWKALDKIRSKSRKAKAA